MADPVARQEPEFQAPTYTITYALDGTLQFDPPPDSPELAIALSLHFPFQRTLKEKMREAQLSFLRSQNQATNAGTGTQHETSTTVPSATPLQPTTQGDGRSVQAVQVPQATPQFHLFDLGMQEPTSSSTTTRQPKSKKRPRKSRAKAAATEPKGSATANQHFWDLTSGETAPKKTRRTLGPEEAEQVAANRGNVCDYHREHRTKCDPAKCPGNKLFQKSLLRPPSRALEASFEDFPGASSCHQKECNITASHSHQPDLDLRALAGENGMIETDTSNVISASFPNQNLNPLLQHEHPQADQGEGDRGMNDAMLLEILFDDFELGQSLHGNFLSGEAYLPLCPLSNFTHEEVFPGDSNEAFCVYDLKGLDEELNKKKKKEEEQTTTPWYSGPGDNGGGGTGGKNGDGGDGDRSGDGGAAGGTGGSGNNGSSNDAFRAFMGDGWYSLMVAVFMLAWFALRTSISVGGMNGDHCSGGPEDDDDASSGEGRVEDVVTSYLDSQLDRFYPTVLANPLQRPPKILDGPVGMLPSLPKETDGRSPPQYSPRPPITPDAVSTVLSRFRSKIQTKTKARESSKPTYAPSTRNDQQAIQTFEELSHFTLLCMSSAVRAF
ncbi:uncharacterized protein PAC_11822 [Phialocephala subalpina]|uniref:Uncharacterized protein n=1 Tax=Phialocephala subalpina TaxID=576137 RepID=A0A1L7XA72_9HELO|nr:uncharacterized protein PAC_11822 [Phialocephala subalpina]